MRTFVAVALVILAASATAHAQPSSAPPTAPDPRRELARTLFESGLGHYDRAEWSAALADFLKSREIFPTRTATENAAVCLRKEGRYDEALDLLEELLRTYSDLSPAERTFAEKQIGELRGSVGSIELTNSEPAASIVIDGRARGTYPPLSGALRVPAGTRVVRVYKEGFVPLELRVDVPGRQSVTIDARLTPITAGGRLVVTEAQGRALDVIVDDVVVGKTPFEQTLPVGRHTVSLRGEGDLGTPPADATVVRDDVTRLALAAEPLDASLRVIPTPAGALVSIDGV
ncbi:MAG TPA: PEGA domain-containing protein, partial [Labilithrix sp.]